MSRAVLVRLQAVVMAVLIALSASASATQAKSGPSGLQNDAFHDVWSRTDRPVAEMDVDRTWMWGPGSFSGVLIEEYRDSPDNARQVAYFDKSRMEINDSAGNSESDWYVTNGLLARDLIRGQIQIGDNDFRQYQPPEINVAGDFDDPNGPTYQTFSDVMSSGPVPVGEVITQSIDRFGNVEQDDSLAGYGVTASLIEPATNHSVASVFWEFMNSTGPVDQNGSLGEARLFQNAYYATGYPLTEPYWTAVRVDGEPREVLVQVFQRRVLTYTPGNPDGWRVESGNVGLHFHHWRYETLTLQTSNDEECLEPIEQDFLSLINEYRRQNGVPSLENSAALNVASHDHSQDMGERNYVAHVSPEGTTPWDRMDAAGYDYNTSRAENIAAGQQTAEEVFDAWRNSPGHNQNMLNPDFNVIGIGRAEVEGSGYGVYWTTKFGGHVDAAPGC